MKIFRFILVVIGIFVVLLFTVPVFLPSTSIVERSIEINKPIDEVYDLAIDFNTFTSWSPWVEVEQKAVFNVLNDTKGVGSKIEWDGDTIGRGYIERYKTIKDELIESDLVFTNPFENKAKDIMRFEPTVNGTKVTWANQMELEYPFGRYLGLFIESFLSSDLEKGLGKLKNYCDTTIKTPMFKITEEKNISSFYYFIADSSKLSSTDITRSLSSAYRELLQFYAKNKLEAPKEQIVLTTRQTEDKQCFKAGFFASDTSIAAKGRVQKGVLRADNALKCVFVGAYKNGYLAYRQLNNYMKARNFEPNGRPWEIYSSDFKATAEKDLTTYIIYPVKQAKEK